MNKYAKGLLIGLGVPSFVGLSIVICLGVVAAYGFRAAQRAGNEAATIQNLKTIRAVELEYFITHQKSFGTFDQLVKEGMLSTKFTGNRANVDGYSLRIIIRPATPNTDSSFIINADPIDSSTGRNHYYVDSKSLVIRVNRDSPASANDDELPTTK